MLNSVHERALHLVEDNDAPEHEDAHEGEAIAEGAPREIALTKGGIFEGLDDRGHGVQHDDGVQGLVSDHTDRIDNRGSIHPELDDEREEDG